MASASLPGSRESNPANAESPAPLAHITYDGPLTPATWGWLTALLLWSVLVAFYDLGGGSAFDPPDVWVAQTAREMRESPDWHGYIIPHFSGEIRLQKSPGPYWAVALTSWLRGTSVDEISARIPGALSAVGLVLTTFWLALRIAGQRAAVFAGFAMAGSVMFSYWSHRAASDLGVTTLMTLSLTALWLGIEGNGSRRKQNCLLLLGYFVAGLAMLYKMPMPLVCIGLPALIYVAWYGRWRVFLSWTHLIGLVLFLLPWLPWVLSVVLVEDHAIHKWRSEFLDRFTGELPNVQEQRYEWLMYLLYVGVAIAYTLPFSLSLPQALWRGFRNAPGVSSRGRTFLLIWFLSLFAFFTAAAGKETRYLLPAMPPLYVLLALELSAFFDPQRRARPRLERATAWIISLAAIGAAVGGGFALKRLCDMGREVGIYDWNLLLSGYVGVAVLLVFTVSAAAWLRATRREGASFAALVGGSGVVFLWAWSTLLPEFQSQAAFRDFATQLRTLSKEQQAALKQVAFQDARVVWYSDVRFPRLIHPLKMIELQGGARSREREMELVGREMVAQLSSEKLVLLVSSLEDYLTFHMLAPERVAQDEGRTLPQTYIWLTARVGKPDHRFIVFGNQPPPWPQPTVFISPKPEQQQKILARLSDARARAAALLAQRPPGSAPAAQTQAAPAREPHE